MKNRRTIGLLLAGLVLLLIMAYFLPGSRHDWRENYDPQSRHPYGIALLADLLSDYFPAAEVIPVRDSFVAALPTTAEQPANFVFVGSAMHLRDSDVRRLLEFVQAGNRALISTRVLPFNLMFELYFDHCDDIWWEGLSYYRDTIVSANLLHPQLRRSDPIVFQFREGGETLPYSWRYFDDAFFCEMSDGLVPIGQFNDSLINFAQRPYGQGSFYLHSNPLAFTNLHLLREEGLAYAGDVFSHLQPGPIYWDEYSAISESLGEAINNRRSDTPRAGLNSDGPLQYVLSQPPLAWAWYLLLLTGLLYIVFASRRRQRIIPVGRKNDNSSLEFIKTIGRLSFLHGDHVQLAEKKLQLFRSFIRQRYHLTGELSDPDYRQQLAQRSAVPVDQINKLIVQYNQIRNATFVSAAMLIDLHQRIESFYRQCK